MIPPARFEQGKGLSPVLLLRERHLRQNRRLDQVLNTLPIDLKKKRLVR